MNRLKKNQLLSFSCSIASLLSLFLAVSCNQQKKDNQTTSSTREIREAKGQVIFPENFKPPKVVLLENVPKPQIIEVPTKAGDSYIPQHDPEGNKIDLLPPETKPAENFYIMQNYNAKNGLPGGTVKSSMRDKMGNLWFGSISGGVSKYDGNSFWKLWLPGSLVNDIYQDQKGNIFLSLENGVSKYDGEFLTSFTKQQGLVDSFVWSTIKDSKGNMWSGTPFGASKFDGKFFTTYTTEQGLIDNTIIRILEDKQGHLWFATLEGVSKFDGKNFTNYNVTNGLVDNYVLTIFEDMMGDLWFGTKNGVSKYDGKTFINYNTHQGMAGDLTRSIFEDRAGKLWFGTNDGVSKLDGNRFINYTTKQGLVHNSVRNIIDDKTGNLWFGTDNGACKYDGESFINYPEKPGLAFNTIRSILEDKAGNLWFGGTMLYKYDGKTFTRYTPNQGLCGSLVSECFQDSSGYLWFCTTNGGVSKFDGKSFTNYSTKQGLPGNFTHGIAEDKFGNIWICTENGLCKYDGKSFTTYTSEQGLAGNFIFKIFVDSGGNLWFSTVNYGVYKYDGKSFTSYNTDQGLPGSLVWQIDEDNAGNLWFSTFGGVCRFDGKSFFNYTTAYGLPVDSVVAFAFTKEQHIALGTSDGVTILKGYTRKPDYYRNSTLDENEKINLSPQNKLSNEELKNYNPVFETYNSKRGYPIEGGVYWNGLYQDSKGILWIGTDSPKTGIVRFDSSDIHVNKNPPNVVIQSIAINNEKIIWNNLIDLKEKIEDFKKKNIGIITPPNVLEEYRILGYGLSDEMRDKMRQKYGRIKFDGISKWYSLPENLKLPYKFNNVAFEFGAIEPDKPQDVLYQYKLEGYDRDWSQPTNKKTANFGNIFEGTYQFKVKAQSPFGVWSQPIIFPFEVLPPWYRTWWAYSGYVISTMLFLYLIYLWRTAVLRKRYKQLERLYGATERFIPKSFLNLLQKEHIEDVKLGDCVKRNISVLFNDIRSFTTLVEKRTPEVAFAFVNRYWKFIAPIIRKHNGYIDQLLGDGLLAIFPNRPEDAVEAAKAMIKALAAFNVMQKSQNDDQVSMGIGISTGQAMLGVLGEENRNVAGIISDVVNTSARIEGLNKIYGSRILLSGTTVDALASQEQYVLRNIDRVLLKGKTKPTEIYEVIDWGSKLKGIGLEEYLMLFYEGFQKYSAGQFQDAIAVFNKCLSHYDEDKAITTLISRCELFLKDGTPDAWNGTFIMTSK